MLLAEGRWLNNPVVENQLLDAVLETLYMTAATGFFTVLFGLPLGVLLHNLGPKGLRPMSPVYRALSLVVDFGRAVPFIVLMLWIIPFTRLIVGTAIGWEAAVVPLTVGAIPFFARMVENSLREVSWGKVEAVRMMGASDLHVTWNVLLREGLPGIVGGLTITLVTLISFTAMAGAVGGGGLGQLAINYGYNRYQADVMLICVILLVLIVTAVQYTGNFISRRLDHR
ncbi:methionine ABC transporter permease [Nesterenkonia lacusekhoensis]|uniref:D-methionine transport system permease protein n=1 Tax=Nesterenkonia lacusekhoensis TaxID=150832 RepID=A0ABS4T4Y9_9MICC|nr:methionine ABC transporter permease [Nesterenkonia lacusekhoensis]MBP2319515.1 D-methionine transport system permease protein [Nesterenkonia lacusekhoensis]